VANPVRVLQVLADTDATAANTAAIELHTTLSGAGLEMRTLALAPGRFGALADTVPAIAPGRRSIAAHTQLHAEQRWADVVVLHGAAAATVAALAGGEVPRLLVLRDEPQRWDEGARVPARARRVARHCAAIVVGWSAAVPGAARHLGVPVDRVHQASTPVASMAPPAPAARAAARAALGVADSQLAVRLVGKPAVRGGWATALTEALGEKVVVLGVRAPEQPSAAQLSAGQLAAGQLSDDQRRELEQAAADVVVVADGAGGLSPEVLRTVASGAVLVAPSSPALDALLQDDLTGRVLPTPVTAEQLVAVVASLDDPGVRSSLGDAARAAVFAQHGTERVRGRWLDLVHSALPSRP
jgi:hypothetical protein